jgi:hypothetical protein
MNFETAVRRRKIAACGLYNISLDPFDRLFRFFGAAVSNKPSRTFRHESPEHQN